MLGAEIDFDERVGLGVRVGGDDEQAEWRVEVRTVGDPKWYRNQMTYSDYFEALVWAMDTLERWSLAEDTRVVPAVPEELAARDSAPSAA